MELSERIMLDIAGKLTGNGSAMFDRETWKEITAIIARHLTQWQPIESAPRDGTEIWAFPVPSWGNSMAVVRWYQDASSQSWVDRAGMFCSPSHWMPLPLPPDALLPALPPPFPSCEYCARGSKAWQKNGVWLHEGGVRCGAQDDAAQPLRTIEELREANEESGRITADDLSIRVGDAAQPSAGEAEPTKPRCPVCGSSAKSDWDRDCGTFYTCDSCGHQWSYSQVAASTPAIAPAKDVHGYEFISPFNLSNCGQCHQEFKAGVHHGVSCCVPISMLRAARATTTPAKPPSDFRRFITEQLADPEFAQAYEEISAEEDAKLAAIMDAQIQEAQRLYQQSSPRHAQRLIEFLQHNAGDKDFAAWIAAAHNLWPVLMRRLKEKPDAD